MVLSPHRTLAWTGVSPLEHAHVLDRLPYGESAPRYYPVDPLGSSGVRESWRRGNRGAMVGSVSKLVFCGAPESIV